MRIKSEGDRHKDSALSRRTNSPQVADFKQLSENQFWQQTQSILLRYLKETEYGPGLYVPVQAGSSKELFDEMMDFLNIENNLNCLLLIGQYGVGKTSALKAFAAERLKVDDGIGNGWIWIHFDGNKFASDLNNDSKSFLQPLANVVSKVIEDYLRRNDLTFDNLVADSVANDVNFAQLRLVKPKVTQKDLNRIKDHLLESKTEFVHVVLRYLVRRVGRRKVVLVLDNLDPLHHEIQIQGVLLATQLSEACDLKAMLAVRRKTETQIRHDNDSAIAAVVRTEVMPPSMTEVIRRRIQQAFSDPAVQETTLGEGTLRAKVKECPEFTDVLVKGLSSLPVNRLLDGLSNESVRDALQFALRVYNSHFIDAHKIIRKISPVDTLAPSLWKGFIPYHIVAKALILSNRPIYRPDVSWVANIFGTQFSGTHLGPFLRRYIMAYLQRIHPGEELGETLYNRLGQVLEMERAALQVEIAWLEKHNCIAFTDKEHLILTCRGKFILNSFVNDIEYLTHIATDVDMYEHLEERLITPADKPQDRLNNLVVLLGYLLIKEANLLRFLSRHGLTGFARLFGSKSFVGTLLTKVSQSVENIRTDQTQDAPNLPNAVAKIRGELNKLQTSRTMQEINGLFKRYVGDYEL